MTEPSHWLRDMARVVSALWGGGWSFFGLASAIGEGLDPPGILFHTVMPGLIFLLSAVIAWRWERVGGVLLILEGLFTLVWLPFAATLTGLMTLSLPPITAGMLFNADQFNIRMHGSPPSVSS